MLPSEKMKLLIEESKVPYTELERKTGISKSALQRYASGTTKKIPFDAVEKVAAALGASAAYIMGWELDAPNAIPPAAQRIGLAYMAAPTPIQRTVEVALEPYMNTKGLRNAPPSIEGAEFAQEMSVEPETIKLRLYTQTVAAGLGSYQDDDDYEMVEFPNAPRRANLAVRVSGDSMEPEYHDGDIVFVETESVLHDGEIGIFNYDGSGYIKQLRLNPARLASLNSEYADILIADELGDTPLRTIGRVVGKA